MKRRREVLRDTVKKSRGALAAWALCFAGTMLVFYLYRLPPEPFCYAFLLIAAAGLLLFAAVYARETVRADKRERLLRTSAVCDPLPPAHTLAEADYAKAICELREELERLRRAYESARQEEIDYYTAWVHQIKTPLAVMRMELGNGDTPQDRTLEAELFRIEQYVDMVLTYIRLGSGGTDLVIRAYKLDELIREAIHKYASQFVAKKLRLDYEGTDRTIVTDRKWFGCILEQLLSNAIKYTPAGGIAITVENEQLCVSDTGIGIAPEDLPRIFERNYTGQNGRTDRRSSGLGLYLCRKSTELLCMELTVESTVGKGSRFRIGLQGKISG